MQVPPSRLLLVPSGQVVFDQITLFRLAPLSVAWSRFELLRSVPSRFAPLRLAPVRFARLRSSCWRLAPASWAPARLAPPASVC